MEGETGLTEAEIAEINYKITLFNNMIKKLSNTVSKLNAAENNITTINSTVQNNYKLNDVCMDDNYGKNIQNDIQNTITYINGTVIPNIRYEISRLERELL